MIYIYKATCTINNKSYIGQTVHFNIRKEEHKRSSKKPGTSLFHKALKKHGFNSFVWEIIEKVSFGFSNKNNQWWANQKEVYWIKYFKSLCPAGYNLCEGGNKPPVSIGEKHWLYKKERTIGDKLKISKANKGKTRSESFKRNRSLLYKGKGNPNYGKPMSDLNKSIISLKNIGRKRTEEHKLKISVANKNNRNNAKLNQFQADEIRLKYVPRKYSTYKLAKEYNVSSRTINLIILNRIWKKDNVKF
jgi:group I intron endonuclease